MPPSPFGLSGQGPQGDRHHAESSGCLVFLPQHSSQDRRPDRVSWCLVRRRPASQPVSCTRARVVPYMSIEQATERELSDGYTETAWNYQGKHRGRGARPAQRERPGPRVGWARTARMVRTVIERARTASRGCDGVCGEEPDLRRVRPGPRVPPARAGPRRHRRRGAPPERRYQRCPRSNRTEGRDWINWCCGASRPNAPTVVLTETGRTRRNRRSRVERLNGSNGATVPLELGAPLARPVERTDGSNGASGTRRDGTQGPDWRTGPAALTCPRGATGATGAAANGPTARMRTGDAANRRRQVERLEWVERSDGRTGLGGATGRGRGSNGHRRLERSLRDARRDGTQGRDWRTGPAGPMVQEERQAQPARPAERAPTARTERNGHAANRRAGSEWSYG